VNRYSTTLIFFLLPCSALLSQTAQTNETAQISELSITKRLTDEERIEFLLNVAQAYFNEEDFDAAINAYERILSIDPEHQQAKYVLGHVYIMAKRYSKAESTLKALADENPEDFKIWNNLAWLYATAEDPAIRDGKKAVKHAQEAMTLAPYDHHVWSTLSEAYYVSGEYEKSYRAITHMANLAARYGTDITKEAVDNYNEQIRKCKRAMDTAKALEEESPDD